MINIHAHFDHEKDNAGSVLIHAVGTIPDTCSDLELIVANIVKGMAKQMPGGQQAAIMFAIAALEGAKRGLREYQEEAQS